MKISKKEKRKRYLRLFTIFEEQLKNYHSIFNNDDYSLSYIICRDYFGGEDEIKVILNLHKGVPIRALNFEHYNLKSLLSHYCRYFPIKEITIMKSARVETDGRCKDAESIAIPKIQDRVFFEYFRLIDKYTEIRP